MANPLAITLRALGTPVTEAGQGEWIDVGTLRTALRLAVDVTAITGAGAKLTLYVETTANEAGGVRQLGEKLDFAQQGAASKLIFGPCVRYVRVRWTVSGDTPSIDFGAAGEAHVLFADPDDVQLPADALAAVPVATQLRELLKATDEAHDYLASAYTPPITAWGDSLRMHVAAMARFGMLNSEGFDPENPVDQLIVMGRKDAITWLDRISQGRLKPPDIIDSTPEVHEGGAVVVSAPRRGW